MDKIKTKLEEDSTSSEKGNDNSTIVEGKAEIVLCPSNRVFYNPVQEFNRDLSVAVLRLVFEDYLAKTGKRHIPDELSNIYPEIDNDGPDQGPPYEGGITILEALAASGLRSIRYAKEIPGVMTIIANDISEKAVNSIKTNIRHNKVEDIIQISKNDASMLMYSHIKPIVERFDAIDLDPYGCPAVFLDSAVQSIAEGGILLVTATDMAVLAGNAPETCYSKYGAISLHSKACHEMALRILLQCIESHANRYGRYIVPLMSVSADFYVRVFVKIFTGQAVCKHTTSKLSLVYQCTGCESITLQPLGVTRQTEKHVKFSLPTGPPVGETCSHCHHKHHVGGPIWSAPIHDADFLEDLEDRLSRSEEDVTYGTVIRMRGLIALLREELLDVPLYYTLERVCSVVRTGTMKMVTFRSALLNAGYRVSYSHASRTSIKTDAPVAFIWHIMRSWEALNPVKKEKLSPTSPAYRILFDPLAGKPCTESDGESQLQPEYPPVNFDLHPNANPPSRQRGLLRFQENPLPNWGPGTRATAMTDSNRHKQKSRIKQGKRSKVVCNQGEVNKYNENEDNESGEENEQCETSRKILKTE